MEHEFALGVVIGLLAPSIEPLAARERELLFAGAAGLARPLFEAVPDRAAADDRLFARFHGLHWLCARLAEVRPLALLVDDAHWADEQSLRFLAYLEARIEEIPACAILAVRTGETAAAPDALTRLIEREPLTAIRPSPLSPAAVAALVRGSLGDETGDEVCVECARTTGGNPLLARQLITAVRERRWQPASLDAAAIAAMGPPSVARFVAARLRRRSPTVVSVARALAILGDDASLVDTAEVAGVDRKVAADAVDALIDAELLHPRLPPSFVHPIIQQALQDSIPPAERAQLHLAAARALARDPARSERAAAHLLAVGAAGPVGEQWALRRADGGGAPGRRPRLCRPCGALPAPGARGGGAGADAALGPARARRRRVGRPPARGDRPHGGGATPVEQPGRARARGPRPVDGALRGRRAAGRRRRLRGRARDGRRARSGAAPGARVPGGRHAHGRRAAQRRDVRAAAGARARGAPRARRPRSAAFSP